MTSSDTARLITDQAGIEWLVDADGNGTRVTPAPRRSMRAPTMHRQFPPAPPVPSTMPRADLLSLAEADSMRARALVHLLSLLPTEAPADARAAANKLAGGEYRGIGQFSIDVVVAAYLALRGAP